MKKAELKDRLHMALNLREKKPVDLAKDLDIPKSAISQYLSGNRTIKDSRRIFAIAKYLDVDEAWLMGFDVPMERKENRQPIKDDELPEVIQELIAFARNVPEDKAELTLRVMKSIAEGDL